MSNYYQLERFFKMNNDCVARDEKGLLKDKIYLACFESTLAPEMINLEINKAVKKGLLKKSKVKIETGVIKNIYMLMDYEPKQRGIIKSKIDTFVRWCKSIWERFF